MCASKSTWKQVGQGHVQVAKGIWCGLRAEDKACRVSRGPACTGVLLHLPHVYFEFGVILRYVFLDQTVGSFLRLAEAGESQWQDIFQLDLLLCRRNGSAFLKYTHFDASTGWKSPGFLNQHGQIWKINFCTAALNEPL